MSVEDDYWMAVDQWRRAEDALAKTCEREESQRSQLMEAETAISTFSEVLAERDAMIDTREVELASVREERDALAAIPKVYLHTTSTGEGCPTGTWRAGEPEPSPTVAALGDPDSVRGLMVVIERGRAAEARVAQLEAALSDLIQVMPYKAHAAVERALALLASQPLPSEPEKQ